jgi:hypothetical protein
MLASDAMRRAGECRQQNCTLVRPCRWCRPTSCGIDRNRCCQCNTCIFYFYEDITPDAMKQREIEAGEIESRRAEAAIPL